MKSVTYVGPETSLKLCGVEFKNGETKEVSEDVLKVLEEFGDFEAKKSKHKKESKMESEE